MSESGTTEVRSVLEPGRKLLPLARQCGACSACCSALDIPSLSKPAHVRCVHVSPRQGCGIYDKRPDGCRTYRCAWRAGVYGGQLDRPDRTGIIVDGLFGDDAVGEPINGVPVVMVREWRLGALDTTPTLKALHGLARRAVCLVVRWGRESHQFTIFAPPGAGKAFAARHGITAPIMEIA